MQTQEKNENANLGWVAAQVQFLTMVQPFSEYYECQTQIVQQQKKVNTPASRVGPGGHDQMLAVKCSMWNWQCMERER